MSNFHFIYNKRGNVKRSVETSGSKAWNVMGRIEDDIYSVRKLCNIIKIHFPFCICKENYKHIDHVFVNNN